ncbi:hypothetical protein [Pseudophaeobacter arcticus]|uniref:hypothetical protein n=1 Tax=Pseudophaeobacter arcticus TaxID=385492 RepID=UPI003A96E9B1
MPLDFPAIRAAAQDLKQYHGVERLLRFLDLGGTITPPSDDPQDWWEPETLTHRADLLGICEIGSDGYAALSAWLSAAAKTPVAQHSSPWPTPAA